ncbi:MAG: response regulator [Armatimonadota bacterium]
MSNLRIVAIDDNLDNLITLKAVMLDALPGCELFTANTGNNGIELARQHDPDVILLDIVMPGMDGFEVCRRLKGDSDLSDIPVLFLTALRTDQRNRTKAIDAGAEGFLSKPIDEIELIAQVRTMAKIRSANRLQRMEKKQLEALVAERTRELEHELAERKRAVQQMLMSELRFRRLFEAAKDGILILDADTGDVMEANPFFIQMTGSTHEDVCGKKLWELGFFKDIADSQSGFLELQKNQYARYDDLPLETADGKRIDVEFISNVYEVENHKVIQCNVRDISERKKAEEQLRQFKTIFDTASFGAAIADMDGYLTYINDSMAAIHGYTASEIIGKPLFMFHNPQQLDQVRLLLQQMQTSGGFYAEEVGHCHRDGRTFTMLMTGTLVKDAVGNPRCFTVTALDLSERKALEEQLQQAQKMESVGRLAGGVAHDFNNMLNVILGYTELISQGLTDDDPIRSDLGEIKKAAEHSAELTRQLLAFARKQTVVPKVLDINETIESSLNMIRRLIGEGIDLAWHPGQLAGQVHMDPAQIGQILTNLCVNARDAINGVGHISISTKCIHGDPAFISLHPDLTPGDYVSLVITDDGCGMNEQTLAKLFEPFFTTKELGKGTGLGLATIYGIVKQNTGSIEVESQPGQGTTFSIYLPSHLGQKERQELAVDVQSEGEMHMTVLLVEDETAILKLGKRMLERQGFNVLAAISPGEALRLAEEHPGEIQLLLTDVVMPEMNGRDLAKRLLGLYPNMKRVYMSGYTADVIAHQGVVDKDVHFLQKPFSMQEMATKVQEVLAEEA